MKKCKFAVHVGVMAIALILALGLAAMAGTVVPTRAPSPLATIYDQVPGATPQAFTFERLDKLLASADYYGAPAAPQDTICPKVALGSSFYDETKMSKAPTDVEIAAGTALDEGTAGTPTEIAFLTGERTEYTVHTDEGALRSIAKGAEAAGTGDDVAKRAQIVFGYDAPDLIAAVGYETQAVTTAGDKAARGTSKDIARIETGHVIRIAATGYDTKSAQDAVDPTTTHQVIASGMDPTTLTATGPGCDTALYTGGAKIVRIAKAITGETLVTQPVIALAA